MQIGPRYKKARYLGAPVFSKTQSEKFALRSQKTNTKSKRPRGKSEYGQQMLEKQKARYSYGVSGGQFTNYVKKALQTSGDNAKNLLGFLESRMDNVVLRAGFVTSRFAARQMVSHGHLKLNGVAVTIPSIQVKVGDVITVRDGSKKKGIFNNAAENIKKIQAPAWLAVDADKTEIKVVGNPTVDQTELLFNVRSVLEFYTR